MDLGSILSSLFYDPTSQGGGKLFQLMGGASSPATTNTPLAAPSSPGAPGGAPTPPPAAQNGGGLLSQFFTPHRGLLGNSMVGDAVRGGLAGLGSSTGYTGMAALGQGARGGIDAGMQRRMEQMQTAGAGQQFQAGQNSLAYQPAMLNQQYQSGQQQLQQGQQQLISGNLANQFTLMKINGVRRHYGLPEVTLDNLNTNPNLVNNPTGQAPTQTAASQPATQGSGAISNPGYNGTPAGGGSSAPITSTPLAPVSAGNLPADPGRAPGSAAALPASPPPPAQAPTQMAPQAQPAPQQQAQAPQAAPQGDPYAKQQQDINDMWDMGQYDEAAKAQLALDQQRNAPTQAAAVDQAKFEGGPAFAANMDKLRTAFEAQAPVKTIREVQPIYDQFQEAEKSHKTAKTADEQLASDMDLTNSMLKLWNPNNANLRPGTVEAVQEAEGWYNKLAKLKQQIFGGTGLSKEVRETMVRSMETHYDAYKKAYDATEGNFKKQAQLYVPQGKAVDESLWNSGYAPESPEAQRGPVQITGPADYANLQPGQTYLDPNGVQRTKQ